LNNIVFTGLREEGDDRMPMLARPGLLPLRSQPRISLAVPVTFILGLIQKKFMMDPNPASANSVAMSPDCRLSCHSNIVHVSDVTHALI